MASLALRSLSICASLLLTGACGSTFTSAGGSATDAGGAGVGGVGGVAGGPTTGGGGRRDGGSLDSSGGGTATAKGGKPGGGGQPSVDAGSSGDSRAMTTGGGTGGQSPGDASVGTGTGGSGGATGSSCQAPYVDELSLATKSGLPRTFDWSAYRECETVNGYPAGSECTSNPCASCKLVLGTVSVASDGLSADVAFTASCEAPAWDGYSYCDVRWAASYKQACTFGLSGTGSVHVVVGAATYLPGPRTLDWQVTTATATGTWTKSSATTCTYFSPGADTNAALNHSIELAVEAVGLSYQCPS